MNIHPERNDQREPARDELWQVTVAEIIAENDRLRARVADLEENAEWYTAMLKEALHKLRDYHVRYQWAREHWLGGVDHDGFTADEREWAA